MSDHDLIRRGDALAAVYEQHPEWTKDAIAALPAVTVEAILAKVPTRYQTANGDRLLHESDILAAMEPVTQPAPDAAAIREAWEKAYWRMRSYAVHDDNCKLNKPPRFDGPCSCGLTAALEEALALLTEKPHDRA